jgi:hypothetical protein
MPHYASEHFASPKGNQMRLLAAALLVSLLTLNTLSAPVFNNCSCNATDGSCSASVSCPGGCIADCPSGGCYATCKKGTNGEGGGGDIAPILMMPINLELHGGGNRQLASEIARITGREFVFLPDNPNEPVNLDVKDLPLWDVLEVLSRRGKVRIGGHDFSTLQIVRKALVNSERMSVCINNVSVQGVVEEFAGMSGLPIRVTSGDAESLVTLSVKGVTLEELLAQVSSQTGVGITLK